jgi:hypothetical protein
MRSRLAQSADHRACELRKDGIEYGGEKACAKSAPVRILRHEKWASSGWRNLQNAVTMRFSPIVLAALWQTNYGALLPGTENWS